MKREIVVVTAAYGWDKVNEAGRLIYCRLLRSLAQTA